MIKLSKRLAAAAKMVRPAKSFADIGCDHGYLPVYLKNTHTTTGVSTSLPKH